MAHLELDYSSLNETSQHARKVAQTMNTYADRINPKINAPLGSLSGGSSGYTSTAATLAAKKASSLRNRAQKYERLAKKIDGFSSNAKRTDQNLRSKLAVIKNENYKNLKWHQKVVLCLESFFHHTVGRTKIGRILNTLHRSRLTLFELKTTLLQKTRDYFAYGNGRYLGNVALGALAVAGAVATLVLAVAAAPVTVAAAIAAVVVAVAAAVGLIITSAQFIGTVADNYDAWRTSDTDPGRARYLGGTKDLNSYYKKHVHNQAVQDLAKAVDITNTICKVVTAIGGLASTGNYVKGYPEVNYSPSNLWGNAVKKYASDKLVKSFTGLDSWSSTKEGANALVNSANAIKTISGNTSSIIKWTQGLSDLSRLGYISQDGMTDLIKKVPNVSTLYDIANSYYDIRKLVTDKDNPLKPTGIDLPSHQGISGSLQKSLTSLRDVANGQATVAKDVARVCSGPYTMGALITAPGGPVPQMILGSTLSATNLMIARSMLRKYSEDGGGGGSW